MKDPQCAICGGILHNRKIAIDRLIEGHLYLFEKVRVRACDQCHEIWIPGSEAERMEQAIQGKLKPRKKIVIPVF